MRPSPEELKQKLLHPDQEVRSAVAYYFADSREADATIVLLAIAAIERFSRDAAFRHYSFLAKLPLSDETLPWVLGELRQSGEIDLEEEDDFTKHSLGYFDCWERCLAAAEPSLLAKHAAEIDGLETLDAATRAAIAERVRLAALSPDELWSELQATCQSRADESHADWDDDQLRRIVQAAAAYPEQFGERVLQLLAERPARWDSVQGWQFTSALMLAAEMRLQPALALVEKFLYDDDDYNHEACQRLFERVASDEAVNRIAGIFIRREDEFLSFAAFCLQEMHSDHAVATCLSLVAHAQDTQEQCLLLSAALNNFATEAIEPARQFVLATPRDPELLEVRSNLLVACDVLGVTFPEQDEWRKDSEGDQEFRRQWYAKHGRYPFFAPAQEADEELDDSPLDDAYADDYDYGPPPTIHNEQPRVGRNDPCPCGSGKKYKKCCLPKARENPLVN